MAEPDYLEGDCDELIKPKKLINPVKNSRNHQDLHRELLMNQRRSGELESVFELLPPLSLAFERSDAKPQVAQTRASSKTQQQHSDCSWCALHNNRSC